MRLYPRLGHQAATALYEELHELDAAGRSERVATQHPAVIWPATGAERVRPYELQELRAAVTAVAASHGFPQSVLRRSDVVTFDREVGRVLFEQADLELAEAAFPQVWSFLALVLLPDVTWWRAQGSSNVERFVCTDQTRHTWARLWQRGHLLTWGAEDVERAWKLLESSGIGEAQLDQIQTRRVAYGQHPDAFRSLLRLYGDVQDGSRFERGVTGFFSRVLRLGAFLDFRGLSEEELYEEFRSLFAELEAADAFVAMEANLDPDGVELTFDELPLDEVMPRLAEGVRASGGSTDAELVSAFEHVSGIDVPRGRHDLVRGIAWQASARQYLRLDESTQRWLPGRVLPAADSRWGGRTVVEIKRLIRTQGTDLDVNHVAEVVFAGRPGKTIRRFMRTLVNEVTAEPHRGGLA